MGEGRDPSLGVRAPLIVASQRPLAPLTEGKCCFERLSALLLQAR